MNGRGIDSDYLITRLLSMDYFHFNSSPLLFAAYFFPFIACGKKRSYLPSEMEEKIKNIQENKHGNFYNYATQGFGNIAFYEPDVSYDYFYEKLCKYDEEKYRWFDSTKSNVCTLESETTRKDLYYVLDRKNLLLKRGHQVPEAIKQELLQDLEISEVKLVLAKLLFYVIDCYHTLPNVTRDKQSRIIQKLNFQFNIVPNIYLGFRKDLDEKIEVLYDRIKFATRIQLCFLDGLSLFGNEKVCANSNHKFYTLLKAQLEQRDNLFVEIILSECNTEYYKNASRFQINISHLRCSKNQLPQKTISIINEIKKGLTYKNLWIKTTHQPLPYSLFIVRFEDEKWDYIKIDMYSPFVTENSERPSMYIFRETDPILFEHFVGTFDKMWRSDEYSQFISEKGDDIT